MSLCQPLFGSPAPFDSVSCAWNVPSSLAAKLAGAVVAPRPPWSTTCTVPDVPRPTTENTPALGDESCAGSEGEKMIGAVGDAVSSVTVSGQNTASLSAQNAGA